MKRMILVLGLASFLVSSGSLADSVIRDGKEWLQPADFTDLAWNEVEAVCPAANNFLCDGELKTIDVTGYTFASAALVANLFNSYGIAPPLEPPDGAASEQDSTWAPAFFLDFTPTDTPGDVAYLACWTTEADASETYKQIAEMTDRYVGDQFNGDRAALADLTGAPDGAFPEWGACLYRAVPRTAHPTSEAVPTMPTYVLLFTMLGLIAVASGGHFRRKFKDG